MEMCPHTLAWRLHNQMDMQLSVRTQLPVQQLIADNRHHKHANTKACCKSLGCTTATTLTNPGTFAHLMLPGSFAHFRQAHYCSTLCNLYIFTFVFCKVCLIPAAVTLEFPSFGSIRYLSVFSLS